MAGRRKNPVAASSSSDQPVGPGNPPVSTRFKKGVSGNPNGRPPKERSLARLIDSELDGKMQIQENGETCMVTRREALAKRLVHGALQGDTKFMQMLLRFVGENSESEAPTSVAIDADTIASFLTRMGGATLANAGEGGA